MANSTNLMAAVLYFSYRQNGWSEKYHLKTATYDEGMAKLIELAAYRRAFMGFGVEINWGRVSFEANPREAKAAEGLPIGFLDSMKKVPTEADTLYYPNDPQTGLVYRFETPTGKSGNRIFRGVPDGMVQNFKYDGAMPTPLTTSQTLAAPDNPSGGSANYYRQSFLRWLITNTQYARRQAGVTPPTWTIENWDAIKPRGIGNRDTGRPFGVSRGRAPSSAV